MEYVKIGELHLAEWNYKKENERTMKKLVANIRENGMIENLVVRVLPDGRREVINGNHRLQAMHQAAIPGTWVCNLGEVSDADARRIAFELNETRFGRDDARLAKAISDILASGCTMEDL
jgi:ParB-like chromosome segregation protein Spo0J